MSNIMDKISDSLSEYKIDIDNMTQQYEKNIQYLAIPLSVSNSSNLRNLISEELIENYTCGIERLNNFYNNYFKSMKEESLNLTKIIQGINEKFESINNKVNETISMVRDALLDIPNEPMEIIHELLIFLKEVIISYNNDLKILKNESFNIQASLSSFKDSLSKEESDILENMKNLISEMGIILKI